MSAFIRVCVAAVILFMISFFAFFFLPALLLGIVFSSVSCVPDVILLMITCLCLLCLPAACSPLSVSVFLFVLLYFSFIFSFFFVSGDSEMDKSVVVAPFVSCLVVIL